MSLVGIPNTEANRLDHKIALPGLLSFLIYGNTTTPVLGLDRVPPQYRPPVGISFVSYHAMVGIGTFFIALTLFASFLRWRGTLFNHRWLLMVFVGSVALAMIANQLGWVAAEVGRQPWVVHPTLLRTADGQPALDANGFIQYKLDEGLLTSKAVSEAVHGSQVLSSIIMFSLVYLLLLAIWLLVLNSKIHKGPIPVHPTRDPHGFLDSGSMRAGHEGSMSEAKEARVN